MGGLAGLLTILIVITVCGTSLSGGAALQRMTRGFGYGQGIGGFFGSAVEGPVASVLVIIYGGEIAVTLYGFGEGIYLLLALEETTRAAADALMRRGESRGRSPQASRGYRSSGKGLYIFQGRPGMGPESGGGHSVGPAVHTCVRASRDPLYGWSIINARRISQGEGPGISGCGDFGQTLRPGLLFWGVVLTWTLPVTFAHVASALMPRLAIPGLRPRAIGKGQV